MSRSRTRRGHTVPDPCAAPPADTTADGDVLVRLPATDRRWPNTLPPVPDGEVLTITVGKVGLLPHDEQTLITAGYRIVGVRSSQRTGTGASIDVLVPGTLRDAHPRWWRQLTASAERVFDLRFGPVQVLLGSQLARHRSLSVPRRRE